MTSVPAEALAELRRRLPGNDTAERPQMQLATIDEDGRPDVRTVLLSEWDADGFVFHTDARSRKAEQLAARPATALALVDPVGRQLTVQGVATSLAGPRRDRAYGRRSPYLRRLAWVNTHELAQVDPAGRRAVWRRFGEEGEQEDLAPPPTWSGFIVRPDRITFWEPDPDGPSHRLEYREGDGRWSVRHLPG